MLMVSLPPVRPGTGGNRRVELDRMAHVIERAWKMYFAKLDVRVLPFKTARP